VVEPHATRLNASLADAGTETSMTAIVAEEHEKSLATVERLYGEMLAARLDRKSVVVAIGGGITGDVAGFAAATFLRGVRLVHVPTTLLAMVDAAIGGKTGVNIPLPDAGGLGKNLIGAFWQPASVLIDPATLRTLAVRDFRCGLAECIKHGIIADPGLFELLAQDGPVGSSLEARELAKLIRRAVEVKARIVERDEREAGERALLNLGHTFAHAIESVASMTLRHGEAVAVGLCGAAHVAVASGRLDDAEAQRINRLIESCGLPTALPKPAPAHELVDIMRYDKKVKDDRIRLVLPTRIGAATVVDDVPPDLIIDAWRALGAST